MPGKSSIEWTDAVWNPVTGCTKISQGCKHCYAATIAERFWKGRPFSDVQCHEDRLEEPMKWRKPRRIFVNSMSDLFHEAVPFDFVDRVMATAAMAAKHSYLILTKRPERMLAYFKLRTNAEDWASAIGWAAWKNTGSEEAQCFVANAISGASEPTYPVGWPLANLWLGVSVEDQQTADQRIPVLLQCPAAVRFVSAEPLLETIDLGLSVATCDCCDRWPSRWIRTHRPIGPDMPYLMQAIDGRESARVVDTGIYRARSNKHGALSVKTPSGDLGMRPGEFDCFPGLDWVIVGGESGRGARECSIESIRHVLSQCSLASVPFFIKQLGAKPRDGILLKLRDSKGGDMSEWPADLRVREWPRKREVVA